MSEQDFNLDAISVFIKIYELNFFESKLNDVPLDSDIQSFQ